VFYSCIQLCCAVCLKAYHVHIRSISHNQNMAEAKKQKALAKKQSGQAVTKTTSLSQSSSEPAGANRGEKAASDGNQSLSTPLDRSGPDSGPKSILKSVQNQSAAGVGRLEEKPARGPNYCDVCCFEFSSSEVCLPP